MTITGEARAIGTLSTGKVVLEVAAVNPLELPSDEFLLRVVERVIRDKTAIQICYKGKKGEEQQTQITEYRR